MVFSKMSAYHNLPHIVGCLGEGTFAYALKGISIWEHSCAVRDVETDYEPAETDEAHSKESTSASAD
jgi:hypothetical protein